ncbi:hypothetical protein, partial [Actinoallomurus sp. NPDC052274]|uniref:hypothetical protein n=1 Tax=Actinoallomurus sp. NPDC052274 TaxID=3155420 RepID=UPI0034226968
MLAQVSGHMGQDRHDLQAGSQQGASGYQRGRDETRRDVPDNRRMARPAPKPMPPVEELEHALVEAV